MTRKLAKVLFLLLVVSLPLVRPFNFTFRHTLIPFTDVLFVLCLSCWIISVIRRESPVYLDRLVIPLSIFLAVVCVSVVTSPDTARSLFKGLGIAYLATLALLTFQLIDNADFVKKVTTAWLLGTFVTLAAAFSGVVIFYLGFRSPETNYFLSHFGSLPAGNYPRIHALFANANMMCNFLNVSVMFALAAGYEKMLSKRTAIMLTVAIVLASILTFSPGIGGIFLSISGFAAAIWYSRGRTAAAFASAFIGISIAAAFLAAAAFSPAVDEGPQTVRIPFTSAAVEPSVRSVIWKETIKAIAERPFTGVGVGIDPINLRYTTVSGDAQSLGDPHNIWLSVAGQMGIPGFVAFVFVIAAVMRKTSFAVGDLPLSYFHSAVSFALLGALLYQGLSGSFEESRHLWVLIGVVIAISRIRADATSKTAAEKAF